jgi:DDE superfamily endonuclease
MDKTGTAVGESQSSRALVNMCEASSLMAISVRQEWITAIERINTAGQAIPPLIIFKAKHTVSAWIPACTPRSWRFATSNIGWTSDSHGFEWLSTVFEPSTRPNDLSAHRLLIMDGHNSHIMANLIAFCMHH